MKNLDLYLKIYKSDLRKDLKLYLYNYIYFNFFVEHPFDFSNFDYLIFYIVNNREIYFTTADIDNFIKRKFENCFIKLKGVKIFDYNFQLEDYIIKKYLKEKFKKFLDFLEKNKDKFKFLEIIESGKEKVYKLMFNFQKELELSDYIEEIEKYLEFLNLYYLFVFKDFDIKRYLFALNRYENAEFILWSSVFRVSNENVIISPDNILKIFLKYLKGGKTLSYGVCPIEEILENLKKRLTKLLNKENKVIIEQYKDKIKKIINLTKRIWDIRGIVFFQIIFKVWCNTDYWSKKLGYKKKVIKTDKFKKSFYKVELIRKNNSQIYITPGIDIPFFKEKVDIDKELFLPIFYKRTEVIKKLKTNKLFKGKNEIIEIIITFILKKMDFIEIKQFNDTIHFIDKESKEVVYKVKVDLKIEEMIS